MRIGLFIAEAAVDGSDVAAVLERARWADAHGFTTGWVPHIPWSLDGLTSLALAGQVTDRIELGSAVMPTWSRHPYAMAQQALTTQAAVGGRLVLGLAHPPLWGAVIVFILAARGVNLLVSVAAAVGVVALLRALG